MRILHFCYSGRLQPGIVKQLTAEYNATLKDNVTWEVVYFTHEPSDLAFVHSTGMGDHNAGFFYKLLKYLALRFFAMFWLIRNRKRFDLVLIRYTVGDMFMFLVSLFVPKYYTVHHTKEFEEAAHFGKIMSKISMFVETTLGNYVLRNASGIVAVTNEILNYEFDRTDRVRHEIDFPGYVYCNGIDVSEIKLAADIRSGVPKLLFVASKFQPWHGLDLLLEAISKSDQVFELHLVGNVAGLCIDDKRVVEHGMLDAEKLDELTAEMDIGIGSLGMFRNSLLEASTLKVREYLASGLAVYATHEDAGLPSVFPYYLSSNMLDLRAIIAAALHFRTVDRVSVRKKAEPFISKDELFKTLNKSIS